MPSKKRKNKKQDPRSRRRRNRSPEAVRDAAVGGAISGAVRAGIDWLCDLIS
ncbi:hypothetical protein [Streptomyces canus]|uniref:hypothetical protein n=1 Tax=Streptomyces canus TaxID=58343 RepID=UPI002DDB895A|nr:hypothetical protein [Streptomyces canus]WSD86676.1 hypothetical protein OG925_21275 [Streptomyces canus]